MSVGEHEEYAKKMGHSLEKSLEYALFDNNEVKKTNIGPDCFKRDNDTVTRITCPS